MVKRIKEDVGSKLGQFIVYSDYTGEYAYSYLLQQPRNKSINKSLTEYMDINQNNCLNLCASRVDANPNYLLLADNLISRGIAVDKSNIFGIDPMYNCLRDKSNKLYSDNTKKLAKILVDNGVQIVKYLDLIKENSRFDVLEEVLPSIDENDLQECVKKLRGTVIYNQLVSYIEKNSLSKMLLSGEDKKGILKI